MLGEVDNEGTVWRGRHQESNLVGEVTSDGRVWRGRAREGELVGEVSDDGNVWRGRRVASDLVGRIEPDGTVWRGVSRHEEVVGEVEPPDRLGGAAALLLLFGTDTEDPKEPDLSTSAAIHAAAPGTKIMGVAHSSGVAVVFSADQNRTFVVLVKEGASGADSPADVNAKFARHRAIHDQRKQVIVVEGSEAWLSRFVDEVTGADAFVWCADERTLASHGVTAIDDGWSPNDRRQIGTLEEFLS